MATYKDPKTGQLYPSEEWYKTNVNPQTGISFSEEKRKEQIAGDFENVKELKVNELSGPPVDVSKAKSSLSGSEAMLEEARKAETIRLSKIQEQRRLAQVQTQQKQSAFASLFGKTKEQETTETFKEIGVDPSKVFAKQAKDIAEVGSLMKDYDAMVAKKDEVMAVIESDPMVQAGLESRKINTEKQYNLQLAQKATGINTRLAIMEMENKNFDRATAFVQQAVENYVYDKKLAYDEMNNFIDQNNDIIKDMTAEDQRIFTNALSTAQDIYTAEKDKANRIGELVLANPNFMPDFNASYEKNVAKFQSVGGALKKSVSGDILSPSELALFPGMPYGTTKGQVAGQIPMSTTAQGNITTAVSEYSSAKSLVNQLSTLVNKVPYKSGVTALGTADPFAAAQNAAVLYTQYLTRSNPDVVNYFSQRDAYLSMITRAAGEKGVLTNTDVNRIKNALPGFNDTAETAKNKMSLFPQLFESIVKGKVQAYMSNPRTPFNDLDVASQQLINQFGGAITGSTGNTGTAGTTGTTYKSTSGNSYNLPY